MMQAGGSKPFANLRAQKPVEDQIDSVAANIQKSVDRKVPTPRPLRKKTESAKKLPMSFYADPDIFDALQKKREEEGVPMNFFINRVLRKALGL